jgi:hypothetical protein
MNTLKPITVLALSKHFAETARGQVAPGEYGIEDSVSIIGTLKVGVDSMYTPTPTLSGLKLGAAVRRALRDEDWSPQKVSAFLTKIVSLALENPADLGPEDLKEAEEATQAVQARVKKATDPAPRKGQVRFSGAVQPRKADPKFKRTKVE